MFLYLISPSLNHRVFLIATDNRGAYILHRRCTSQGLALAAWPLFRGFRVLGEISMIANVYVDGFNLYFGSVRGTPYKWLDLNQVLAQVFPEISIKRLRYFTAKVTPRASDPDVLVRQKTFLRALRTIPKLSIHYGRYLENNVRMPLAADLRRGNVNMVEVVKSEEKGSDVNLATYMIDDAWRDDFEVAVLLTNDTDYLTPIKILRQRGYKLWILSPTTRPGRSPSPILENNSDRLEVIARETLRDCQFPATLTDHQGAFNKPADW